MINTQPDASLSDGHPGRRVALAGMVGIILPVALLGWVFLMVQLFPNSSQCSEYFGCLGYLFLAWEYGRWIAVALAWPLLHLMRVRPAWPVAVLAALFLTAVWKLAEALLFVAFSGSLLLMVFGGVVAYPVAAQLARARTTRRALITSVAAALALYAFALLLPAWLPEPPWA
jgi:hypothetical protein